ncbi:MAG: Sec-independent protein translocase protein TatB [Pseudomonadota bacterium]
MPFDIGFIELCVVMVVGLFVLGPDKLPIAARALTRWFGGAKRSINAFKSEVDRELQMDELKRRFLDEQQRVQTTLNQKMDVKQSAEDFLAGKSTQPDLLAKQPDKKDSTIGKGG